MSWIRSARPSLKLWGQQLTKAGEKENYKHSPLLFHGNKHLLAEGSKSTLSNAVSLALPFVIRAASLMPDFPSRCQPKQSRQPQATTSSQ